MKLKFFILLIVTLMNVCTISGQHNSQAEAQKDSICSNLRTNVQILDSKLNEIKLKLNSAESIEKATLDKVNKDTFWDDVQTNIVASFIYDILGFNGNTTGSIIAKSISFLYLIYLCIRAYDWWKKGRKKSPILLFLIGLEA